LWDYERYYGEEIGFYSAPDRAGDVQENTKKVLDICEAVHTSEIVPVVPYLVSLQYLNDEVHEDRAFSASGVRAFG